MAHRAIVGYWAGAGGQSTGDLSPRWSRQNPAGGRALAWRRSARRAPAGPRLRRRAARRAAGLSRLTLGAPMQPTYRLLGSLALILGLAACTPQDPHQKVSVALTSNVLLPAYHGWSEANRALEQSARAFCAGE